MVGIVILNFNKYQLTLECMKSIQEKLIDYHVYIVDNGSTIDNYTQLKMSVPVENRYTLIRNDYNLGFSAGMNVGVRKAIEDGCDYIVFTNSDIVFKQDNIVQLVNTLNEDSSYGIVGPRIVDQQGNEQHFNVWKRESLFQYLCLDTIISVLIPRKYKFKFLMNPDELYFEKRDAYSLSGCVFVMRCEDVLNIGLLDEYTFLYSEEFILAEQMIKLNKKVCYDGSIDIIHNHQGSTTQGSFFVEEHRIRSRMYYLKEYRKAPYWYRSLIYYLMLIVPLCIHKVDGKRSAFYKATKKYVR